MSNVIGKNITLTLFGESHGPYVGATLDGLPSGIPVSEAEIQNELSKRRPSFVGETPRHEKDDFQIISGVFQGFTTGAPLTILIPNENVNSKAYESEVRSFRPNHADYVAHEKYHGFEDYRGGGHFSGRISAAIVAVCAIIKTYLESKGIQIASHILSAGGILDEGFDPVHPEKQVRKLLASSFPLIDQKNEENMRELFEKVAKEHDSLGGQIETAIIGLPVGLGEPWFGRFDGVLSNAIMSIGGVRGVVFGDIDSQEDLRGSSFNDPFILEGGEVKTKTNHSGGVQGGISNGMPVLFHSFVKPTPSIGLPQQTVNENKEATTLSIQGRHDPCFLRRVTPVINALTAFVTMDFLLGEFGRK